MFQTRRNDHSRKRRIKRDLYNAPKKGVAGLRINSLSDREQEEVQPPVVREIRGAERSVSPASDNTGNVLTQSLFFYLVIKKLYRFNFPNSY